MRRCHLSLTSEGDLQAGMSRAMAAARSTLVTIAIAVLIGLWSVATPALAETWRGLVVAPEDRCSPYDPKEDYRYPQSVEDDIVGGLGAVYGPYTGTCFASTDETDIEHIVSLSEAHDSGLCSRARDQRRQFASDIRNLTLASPGVNRHEKSGKDAAEWLPERSRCWFAGRVLEVRRAYGLTIDRQEADALEAILSNCMDTDMEPMVCIESSPPAAREVEKADREVDEVLALYDDDANGRISCDEARRHGIAPVRPAHPAYGYMRDGDGDRMVCE